MIGAMSNYEDAPSTKMIATDCACCGRPLRDAKSVETGMGPHCRAKHGYDEALEVDFLAVASALASTLTEEHYVAMVKGVGDARQAANKIVHHIACMGLGMHVAPFVAALRELGFVKLSDIMSKRLAEISIARTDSTVEVEAPFSEEFNHLVRQIPSRRWVKNEGRKGGRNVFSSTVPGVDARVFGALRKAFPGKAALGPKGLFKLPEAS